MSNVTASRTEHALSALGYVKKFAGKTLVVKLGGAALQDPTLVRSLCEDFALIRAVGVRLVIVHGGGPAINEALTLHGIQWSFIDGQRVTTPPMMDVVEQVLCGKVNRGIVRTLNASGVSAVGISGADARTLRCKPASRELGQVGRITEVNTSLLETLLAAGHVPVVAPTGIGLDGEAYNVNADWAASRIAETLGVAKLMFLTDQDGIWDAQKKVVSELDAGELLQLIETGAIQGGMLAKSQAMIHALKSGVDDVHVMNARHGHALIEELFTDQGIGTVCRKRTRAPSPSPSPSIAPPTFRSAGPEAVNHA